MVLDCVYFIVKVWRHIEPIVTLHIIPALFLFEEPAEIQLALHYLAFLLIVEPLDPFTLFPKTALLTGLRHQVSAKAMLLASCPLPLVAPPVRPAIDPKAVLFIVLVLTLVHTTVFPSVDAAAMHVVVEPFALIFPAV